VENKMFEALLVACLIIRNNNIMGITWNRVFDPTDGEFVNILF
jgi:hypothetical protein